MFSHRFHWDLRPNRLTESLANLRRAGAEIFDLTESNPTHAGLEYPLEILQAFADPRVLTYNPLPAGMPQAREAVSSHYSARGLDVSPERILLTASTSEAYGYLFKLLADPGDEVLVPRPSYPLFEYLAGLESVEVTQYPLFYHGRWSIDFDSLEHAINRRTRAIVLVNPNNPTGSYLKRDELQNLISICAKHHLPIISDEVFSDYDLIPDDTRVTSLTEVEEVLTFSMSGLSKIAGLPQMKFGWIVASGPKHERAESLERLEWISDTYLSVSTPVQCAAPQLMAAGDRVRHQISARTRANLGYLRDAIGPTSPYSVLPVEGGWYAILQVPRVKTEEEWVLGLLERSHVLVQPGFFYDFESEAYLVLSLLTEPSRFEEGLRRVTNVTLGS